jgi:hypothetical protein
VSSSLWISNIKAHSLSKNLCNMSCLVFLLRLSWWLFFLLFYSLKQSLKHGAWQQLLRAAPPILGIWPCNSISPIQDLLICWFQAPPINMNQSQNLLITNHLDQSIYLANQEQVLDCAVAFASLSVWAKMLSHSHFCGTCGANFYWSYCAVCWWRCL